MDFGFSAKGGILSVALKDGKSLYNAYMPFVKGGGLFFESSKDVKLGDEVFVLLQLLDNPEPIPVSAKVIWVTPKGSTVFRPGIGIQLGPDNRDLMNQIEAQLGGVLNSQNPTLTL
jgi:type IV pilus assembly protein PilZ